ncbi:hypothetical protein DBZ45_06725 [Arthrobacter globiformis]|uniref:Uncharacterized protein n=1 Tax=Arthrobacter globiformis TaxID=1665 RepID=A0A328HHQ7_ARTGO|nr:hypothetical protein DBZ45_06725 [Arthrobacter globiformis]
MMGQRVAVASGDWRVDCTRSLPGRAVALGTLPKMPYRRSGAHGYFVTEKYLRNKKVATTPLGVMATLWAEP